jgi:hypothetical protein
MLQVGDPEFKGICRSGFEIWIQMKEKKQEKKSSIRLRILFTFITERQCCGSGMFYPVSRIRILPLLYPGCGSRIGGVKKHRIPDADPQHC